MGLLRIVEGSRSIELWACSPSIGGLGRATAMGRADCRRRQVDLLDFDELILAARNRR